MEGRVSTVRKLIKEHIWGLLLIIVLLIGSNFAVKMWKAKHPGAMSVIEAQAMDMTAMKPPVGAVPVATEVVGRSGFTAKVTYTGSVAPLNEQNIFPRVEGWLKDLRVYNGDKVAAGQLLAVVDSPDLQSKVAEAAAGRAAASSEIVVAQTEISKMAAERAAAQGEIVTAKSELEGTKARLSAMRRGVTKAEKELKSARANLDYWKSAIRREENLLKAGAVSKQEYESEKAQAITAEAEVENKEAMLEEAKANVQAMQAEVSAKQSMISVARQMAAASDAAVTGARRMVSQKSAMANQASAMVSTAATIADYRNIRAPFSGVVTKRYISPGQLVNAGTAVLNLVQIDKVRLQANVADKDIDRIQIGAPVVARLPKNPTKAYYAKVTSVSPQADQASRTALVEAVIDNPGHKLVPGDFVTMDIAASASTDSISVPTSALISRDGRDAVWVVKHEAPKGEMTYYCTMHPEVTSENPNDLCPKCNMKLEPKTSDGGKKAHLVYVTLGQSNGDRTEIVYGLSDGDEVIYQGHTYLKEGETVFPTKWGKEGPEEMPKAPGMGSMPGMDHSKMDHGKQNPKSKIYYCPMDPEVTSDKPGQTCPKCNMFLEEKK